MNNLYTYLKDNWLIKKLDIRNPSDLSVTIWCVLAVIAVIGLTIAFCQYAEKDRKERIEWRKNNPVPAAQNKCHSKSAGSRPACWTEGDWKVFCDETGICRK